MSRIADSDRPGPDTPVALDDDALGEVQGAGRFGDVTLKKGYVTTQDMQKWVLDAGSKDPAYMTVKLNPTRLR